MDLPLPVRVRAIVTQGKISKCRVKESTRVDRTIAKLNQFTVALIHAFCGGHEVITNIKTKGITNTNDNITRDYKTLHATYNHLEISISHSISQDPNANMS